MIEHITIEDTLIEKKSTRSYSKTNLKEETGCAKIVFFVESCKSC